MARNRAIASRWLVVAMLVLTNVFAPCRGWTQIISPCPNLVQNPGFESATSAAPPNAPTNRTGFGDPANTVSPQIQGWQQASLGPTSWFKAGASDPDVGVPANYANTEINSTNGSSSPQPARLGSAAYAGVAVDNDCHCSANSYADYRGYVAQELTQPLNAGHYYVEFYSMLAAHSAWKIDETAASLGLRISSGAFAFEFTKLVLTTGVAPQISANDGLLNSTTQWSRTAGCFQAVGTEKVLTAGYFNGYYTPYLLQATGIIDNAHTKGMYFLEDVGVFEFPHATFAGYDGNCQARLAASGLLPTSSNASYAWYDSQNQWVGNGPSVVVPAAQGNTYTLQIIVPSATPGQAAYPPVTTTVAVQALPSVAFTVAGPQQPICVYDPTMPIGITAQITTSVAGTTYQLQTANGTLIGLPVLTPGWQVMPIIGITTYVVQATTPAGCVTSAQTTVTTLPAVSITLSGPNSPVCPGASFSLIGVISPATTPAPPGTLYTLVATPTNGVTYSPTITPNWTVSAPVTTTYTVRATTPAGCTTSATATVQVIQLPTVQVSPVTSTVTAASQPFDLTATVDGVIATGGLWFWYDANGSHTATGNPFNVDPSQLSSGQYMFTYTYAGPCGNQLASAYVTVVIRECLLEQTPYVITLDTVYDATSAQNINLFNDPAVTYYLDKNVRLINGAFFAQAGCRILFAKGVKLTIGPGAYFAAYSGATFTAACGEMWDGVLVADGSSGFDLTDCTISQSQRGIVLQYPDLNMTLRKCAFENNLQSVTIVPGDRSQRKVDAMWQNFIVRCTFTANDFALPWAGQTRMARTHLNIGNWDMRAWEISNNLFDRALMGIYAGSRRGELQCDRYVGATIHDNIFTDCPIAGVINTQHRWQGTLLSNHFLMSSSAAPGTEFVEETLRDYLLQIAGILTTTGVNVTAPHGNTLLITNNEFLNTSPPPSYIGLGSLTALTSGPRGIVIPTGNPIINGNIFRSLRTGVAVATQGAAQVVDNMFDDCQVGARLTPHIYGSGFAPAIRLTCNSFLRTTDKGQSAAILLEQGGQVELAYRDANGTLFPAAAGSTPKDAVKNLFAGPQSGMGNEYWHVHNYENAQNPSLSNPQVRYKTFAPHTLPGGTAVVPASNTSSIVVSGNVNVTSLRMPPYEQGQHTCLLEDQLDNYGLQRSGATRVAGSATTFTLAPNPADASVTFTYEVPADVAVGEVLLRESISGQVVARYSIVAGQNGLTISTAALPPGLYLGMLTGGGRSIASVRLQIAR